MFRPDVSDGPSATFQVAGLRGLVTTNDRKFLGEFQEVFFERAEASDPVHVRYSVYVDRKFGLAKKHSLWKGEDLLCFTPFYPSLLPALENDISRTLLETFPGRRYLRAGLVSSGGLGILIPQKDEAGCGWLVKSLVDQGGDLFADAITILDFPELAAIPYPKSIRLERPHLSLLSQPKGGGNFRDPSRQVIRYSPPPRLPERRPGLRQGIHCILAPSGEKSGLPRLDPLPKGEALFRLMEGALNIRKWDGENLSYLTAIVESASCLSLVRGTTKATADLIVELAKSLNARR